MEMSIYFHDGSTFLTDSPETSKAKVTVEMSHSSVKMRAAAQLPVIGPDDDLTVILLQVGNSFPAITQSLHITSMSHHLSCFSFPNLFRYSP